jgi:hypothetical protein
VWSLADRDEEGIVLAIVTIRQEALPVVRSSIALKRQALEFNYTPIRLA